MSADKFNAVIKRRNSRRRSALFAQKSRKFLFSKLSLLALLVLIIIGSLAYYFFISDKFLVRDIQVSGASAATETQVRDHLQILQNTKVFLVFKKNKTTLLSPDSISQELLSGIPKIKTAKIEVVYPDSLKLQIEERTQQGIWCNYGQEPPSCYFYDENGVIYQTAPNNVRGSLIVAIRDKRGVGANLGEEVLSAEIIKYTDDLAEALYIAYSKPFYITIQNENELRAGFSAGWEAYFSLDKSVLESVENLLLVLEEEVGTRAGELEYIDLRLGNKVFYKFKDAD